MSGDARVIRNVLWLGCATGGSLVTSLVYSLLAARYLGPADFGRFSLIVGVGALMAIVAQGAGTSVLTILTAQRFRSAGELLFPGMMTQALIGMACLALSAPLVPLLGGDRALFAPTVVYCAGLVCFLIYSAPLAIFRGLNQMQWSIVQALAGLLTAIGVWFVARRGATLYDVVAVSALSQAAVLVAVVLFAIGLMPGANRWRMERPVISEVLRKTLGLSGVTVFQSVHWKTGLIMVQLLGGAYALGIYTAGAKPIESLRTVPIVLMSSILPSVSHMVAESSETFRQTQVLITRIVLLLMFPLVGALVALSPVIINLLYGRAYQDASMVFSLSLLAVIPGTVHLVLTMPLVVNHAISKLSMIYSIAILAEVLADLLLYPGFGLRAAVAGAVLASAVTAILADGFAFPGASVLRDGRIVKILAAGAISLAVPFTGILESQRWVLCGLAIFVFLLLAGISKSFAFDELRRSNSLFGR